MDIYYQIQIVQIVYFIENYIKISIYLKVIKEIETIKLSEL